MKYMISLGVGFFLIGLLLAPVGFIWALNTLFPVLAIPVTWETYFAIMFLNFFLSSSHFNKG